MHLMIDLETLSLAPNAVVTQIGWALFDPHAEAGEIGNSGSIPLNAEEQVKRGRNFSYSTFTWWMAQSDEARKLLLDHNSTVPVVDILTQFMSGFTWSTIEGVWANGILFDLVILENLLTEYCYKTPWHYRAPRDFKTLRALRPNVSGPKPAIAHSARHDAISQAITVQHIMHSLLNEKGA